MGLSLPLSDLEEKWSTENCVTAHEVLKLCRKFLGAEFDNWLKSHQISVSQQSQLIKKLEAEGLPRKQLLGLRLEELKAIADEEEVPYFSMNKDPTADWYVVNNEYCRLLPNGELRTILRYLEEIYYDAILPSSVEFVGDSSDYEEFRSWIVNAALKQLHGQCFDQPWKGKSLCHYFKMKERTITHQLPASDDYDDIL
jgi:hypothetical protein